MSLQLNAATSGSTTLVPTDAVTATLTLPSSTGTLLSTANPQSGGVIQVVSASFTTQLSTSSTTFADSGIGASITPKFSTSKVFVIVSVNGMYTNGQTGASVKLQIARNGTGISGAVFDNFLNSTTGLITGSPISYLDSPSTTSSVSYTLQFARSNGNTVYIGYSNDVSTITLMEIAA